MKVLKLLCVLLLLAFISGCGQSENAETVKASSEECESVSETGCGGCAEPCGETEVKTVSSQKEEAGIAKVTFVELGSVNCIPCKQMQPVMKAIEENYGNQVKVVFHDVWKPEEKHFAEDYGVKIIPTQVFLDENGKEFFRHEGFFPEAEINKLLQERGLKAVNQKES